MKLVLNVKLYTEFECCIFFPIYSKSTNIENRVQICRILYYSQPIRLQIFFRVSDNTINTKDYYFT